MEISFSTYHIYILEIHVIYLSYKKKDTSFYVSIRTNKIYGHIIKKKRFTKGLVTCHIIQIKYVHFATKEKHFRNTFSVYLFSRTRGRASTMICV